MKIIVLSDTHMPRTSQNLPETVYENIRSADLVLHAGDIVDAQFLKSLERLKKTVAVHGNMDSPELKQSLKRKEIIKIGTLKIGLIHGYGPPHAVAVMAQKEFKNVNAVVFGHTHSPVNYVKNNILYFNPGSPTDKVFSAYNSFGILTVDNKSIQGKIVRLEDS